MTVNILSRDNDRLVLEISIPNGTVMLEGEQRIEQALNEAGSVASGELLKRFDTDGSAIQIGDTKLMSKGQIQSLSDNRTSSLLWAETTACPENWDI